MFSQCNVQVDRERLCYRSHPFRVQVLIISYLMFRKEVKVLAMPRDMERFTRQKTKMEHYRQWKSPFPIDQNWTVSTESKLPQQNDSARLQSTVKTNFVLVAPGERLLPVDQTATKKNDVLFVAN